MFITNNHASFHLWWNEKLVKYQKVLSLWLYHSSTNRLIIVSTIEYLISTKRCKCSLFDQSFFFVKKAGSKACFSWWQLYLCNFVFSFAQVCSLILGLMIVLCLFVLIFLIFNIYVKHRKKKSFIIYKTRFLLLLSLWVIWL